MSPSIWGLVLRRQHSGCTGCLAWFAFLMLESGCLLHPRHLSGHPRFAGPGSCLKRRIRYVPSLLDAASSTPGHKPMIVWAMRFVRIIGCCNQMVARCNAARRCFQKACYQPTGKAGNALRDPNVNCVFGTCRYCRWAYN